MPKRAVLLIVVALLVVNLSAWAAPAAPIEVSLTQQDTGARFQARPKGDEYVHWMEALDGRTIVEQDGVWFYATQTKSGALQPSTYRADGGLPKALNLLPPHLHPPVAPSLIEKNIPRKLRLDSKSLSHTQYVLVILVDFNDVSFTYSDASFESLIFGASDSVKDYYLDNTFDEFVVTPPTESYGTANDGIVHVSAGTNHPNYGSSFSSWRTVADNYTALADPYVDFSAYDTDASGSVTSDELSVVLILAGYENAYGGDFALTPRAWGHKSTMNPSVSLDGKTISPYTIFGEAHATSLPGKHQATIGIMCHELGHLMLGLPDLYDTDSSSNGIGDWGLMGGGNWNSNGGYSGTSPSHFCAWSRATLDIITPTDLSSVTLGVSLSDVETHADIKRIWIDKYKSPFNEYFLAENRQQTGYDAGIPGSGVLLWHIDGTRSSNADESHKWVDLEEADGLDALDNATDSGDAGDPYPGTSNNTYFDDLSTPNAKDYDGNDTGVIIENISASASTMTADISPGTGGTGDNITYADAGANTFWGYGNTTMWTAIRFTNDTNMNTLDGLDIYLAEASPTIELYVCESLSGTTPTNLLYSETGLSGSAGWNRFLFATPQSFPENADRVVVVRIVGSSYNYPAAAESTSSPSGRCYIDSNGIGSFSSLNDDLAQAALLSYVTPLTLTAPNGGESWQVGSTQSITWDDNGAIGASVKLKLYKGGVLHSFLTGTISNTGTYSWSVPTSLTPGDDYDIVVYTPDYLYTDASDARFSIAAPPLYLTAPNGGESWQMGTTQSITWTHDVATGDYVKFKLYKGGVFQRFLGGLFPNSDSYAWKIPTDLAAGSDYRIFLYTPDYVYTDYSLADFTITDPALRITAPNGGESWQKGTVHDITWNHDVATGGSIKFKLYKGGTFLQFLTGVVSNNGTYSWYVPTGLSAGSNYQILGYTPDYLYADASDGYFSVTD